MTRNLDAIQAKAATAAVITTIKLNEIIQDIANLCLCMVKGNHAVLLLERIQMKKKNKKHVFKYWNR